MQGRLSSRLLQWEREAKLSFAETRDEKTYEPLERVNRKALECITRLCDQRRGLLRSLMAAY